MDDYASIQVFNLLMHKGHGHLNFTLVERNNYDAEAKVSTDLKIILGITYILPHYFYVMPK